MGCAECGCWCTVCPAPLKSLPAQHVKQSCAVPAHACTHAHYVHRPASKRGSKLALRALLRTAREVHPHTRPAHIHTHTHCRPASKWGSKLALRALLRTAREVAQGMWHIHSANVIHGDLKPGNVLLKGSRADRRGFIAKVCGV